MWRFLALVLILAAGTIGVMWYGGWLPLGAETLGNTRNGGAAPGAVFKVENTLEVGKGAKPAPAANVAAPRPDTITISDMALEPIQVTEISSRIDGRIQDLPVKLGQLVKKGDRLCTLEDQVAKKAELLAKMKADSLAEKIKAAKLQHEALAQIVVQDDRAGAGISAQEKLIHRTQRDKAYVEWIIAQDEKKIADEELLKVQLEAQYHYIDSNRDGYVVKIYNNRRPGETIKAGEPLFKIVDDAELRSDGVIEAQLAPWVKTGMKALIEPEIPMPAYKELRRHTGPVTGLAVTPDGRLLASASRDQRVILWDWREGRALAQLLHLPDEVYAVAAGPVQKNDQGQTTYTFLAGCDHARVVLWRVNVDATGRLVGTPEAVELKEGHRDRAPVRCVAVSDNGKYAVSGGDDYQICVWDIEAGKLAYRVQERAGENERAHRGAVTTAHILPDGYLLSAAADKLLKKWRLGAESAELVHTEKDRSGDVRQLGITADGKRVLFDTGEELRILDTTDGTQLGALHSRRQSRFSQLAVFSPGGRTILTVSAGRLQLWAAPESASDKTLNAFEIRQLVVPDAAQVTCGAYFAPGELAEDDPKNPRPSYCFTAGEDRTIRVWQCPPAAERVEPIEAVITYVGQQVERGGTGLLQVRAEFKNPTDPMRRLMAGRRVSLTLYPETTTAKK